MSNVTYELAYAKLVELDIDLRRIEKKNLTNNIKATKLPHETRTQDMKAAKKLLSIRSVKTDI